MVEPTTARCGGDWRPPSPPGEQGLAGRPDRVPRRPLWRSWPHVAVAGGSLLLAAAMWTGAALHWSDWHDDLGRQVEAMRVATRLRDALEDSHRRAAGVAALLAQLQASDARLAGSGALERGLRNALTGPSGDFDGVQLLEAGGRRLLAVGQPVGVPDSALRALPLPGLLWHQDQLLLAGRVPATDGQAERLYVGTLRPVTLADALRGEPSFVALRLNGGALVAILGTQARLLEHGAPLPDADAATPSPQGATRHRISAPLPFGDAELVLESGSDAWLRHNVLWSGAALAAAQLAATLLLLGWLTRRLRHIEAHHAQDAARARDCAMRRITELLGALPAVLFRAETLPDRSLRLTSVSDNAGRITGLGWPGIAQPGAWRERVHPEDRAALARHRERLHRDGASSAEYRIRHGDGRTLWLREQAQVVPAGRPGGTEVMGYLADITAERRLQEQAMAGAKLATLGRMAASLAHELTQPIGVMMLAAENGLDAHAAEGAAAAPAMAAKLGRILQQTRRAQALVEHLRVFGRGDRGPVGPVDLAGAVEGALLLCAAVLQRGGVAAEVLVPPGLPPVAASPVLLEQVIVNLLLNAHDALQRVPEGRRGLSLRARAAPGGGVELRVADSGPGLPPEVMARLFEPFLTTKAPGQGMGLGLSICHGIIRSFGGEITGGNDGHGAVFTIRLPAHGAAPP